MVILIFAIALFYGMTDQAENPGQQSAPNDFVEKLAARIRSIREQKGFKNYEKFANAHDFARSQFGRYETGEDLRFTSLVKVVKAFDMTLQEFFSEGFD